MHPIFKSLGFAHVLKEEEVARRPLSEELLLLVDEKESLIGEYEKSCNTENTGKNG